MVFEDCGEWRRKGADEENTLAYRRGGPGFVLNSKIVFFSFSLVFFIKLPFSSYSDFTVKSIP